MSTPHIAGAAAFLDKSADVAKSGAAAQHSPVQVELVPPHQVHHPLGQGAAEEVVVPCSMVVVVVRPPKTKVVGVVEPPCTTVGAGQPCTRVEGEPPSPRV